MWMCYAAEFWEKVEDLPSGIRRMESQFRALAFDACHAQNYDLSVCWDPEAVEDLKDLENKYLEGIEICDLYLNFEISLECFLYELVKLEFQGFIQPLREFLPTDLKDRFTEEEVDRVSTSSSNNNEDGE